MSQGTTGGMEMTSLSQSAAAAKGGGGLAAALQDPEVLKNLGTVINQGGKALGAMQKMPPEFQGMFKQVVGGGGGGDQQGPAPTGVFQGDMATMLQDPMIAQQVLRSLGIPSGMGGPVPMQMAQNTVNPNAMEIQRQQNMAQAARNRAAFTQGPLPNATTGGIVQGTGIGEAGAQAAQQGGVITIGPDGLPVVVPR